MFYIKINFILFKVLNCLYNTFHIIYGNDIIVLSYFSFKWKNINFNLQNFNKLLKMYVYVTKYS